MLKPVHVVLGVLALLAAGSVAWLVHVVTRGEPVAAGPRPGRVPTPPAPALTFVAEPIGIAEGDHPVITSLAIADVDADGLPDVVVADASESQISWIRQAPRGVWTENILPGVVPNPVRVAAGDFTGDGKIDLVVGVGGLAPSDDRTGRVLLIEHAADATAVTTRTLVEHIWPVTDMCVVSAEPNGRAALIVATAGRRQGELRLVEFPSSGDVRSDVIATGGRMLAVAADARPGAPLRVATLEDGEREVVRVHLRATSGRFEGNTVWTAPEPHWRGDALRWGELDRNGQPELVVANGDRLDRYPNFRGAQGVYRLGQPPGSLRWIARFPGCHTFALVDLNGDGRIDLVAGASGGDLLDSATTTVAAWLNAGGEFTPVPLAGAVERVAAVAVGDLDGNGVPVIVTGAFNATNPAERSSRVTLWRRH